MIFDSHAHYDDTAFDTDRDALLASFPQEGVIGVINAASDMDSAQRSVAFAQKYPFMWAAVGIHPEAADRMTDRDIPALRELAQAPRVVAIGEIGLDYHYPDGAPREQQIACFDQQLTLARELDLPVIVHDRDAHEDTLALLKKHRPRGVVHCFSGSVEMMREITALGMYVGLGGAVTFKNAKKLPDVVKEMPLDRFLLETDAPYLAPVPFRGKTNNSSLIYYSAEKIGEIRGISTEDVLKYALDNTLRLYNL